MPMVRVSNGGTGILINLVTNPISGLTIVPYHASVDGDHYIISGSYVTDASGVVVRNTSGKNYGIVITSSKNMRYQAGYCTNAATLPTIITQGAGRSGLISSFQVYGNTLTTDSTSAYTASIFFGGSDPSVNPNNAKIYVYAVDLSKL